MGMQVGFSRFSPGGLARYVGRAHGDRLARWRGGRDQAFALRACPRRSPGSADLLRFLDRADAGGRWPGYEFAALFLRGMMSLQEDRAPCSLSPLEGKRGFSPRPRFLVGAR